MDAKIQRRTVAPMNNLHRPQGSTAAMNRNPADHQRGQTVLLLLSVLFLGSASLALSPFTQEEARQTLETALDLNVHDVDRRNASKAIIARWREHRQKIAAQQAQLQQTLMELLSEHGTEIEMVRPVIADIVKLDTLLDETFMDTVFSLRSQLTRNEWERIFAPESSLRQVLK